MSPEELQEAPTVEHGIEEKDGEKGADLEREDTATTNAATDNEEVGSGPSNQKLLVSQAT